MGDLCYECQMALDTGGDLPCFAAGGVCPGPPPPPPLPPLPFPVSPSEDPADSLKRSVSPESFTESIDSTFNRPTKSPAQQLNYPGSQIRKTHDSHRGGFRRSSRLLTAKANPIVANKHPVHIERPAPGPVPLKQPAARGRPRGSKNKKGTNPRGTGSLLVPNAPLHMAAVPPFEIPCDCQSCAVVTLEELETFNHKIQEHYAPLISQHLVDALATCDQIVNCNACNDISEMMILAIIVVQKIAKMLSRLTTRFIGEDKLHIILPGKEVPLSQFLIVQQLKLEKALDELKKIANNRQWEVHTAMLAPICQHSKDTMDRLRRLNGLKKPEPFFIIHIPDDDIDIPDDDVDTNETIS